MRERSDRSQLGFLGVLEGSHEEDREASQILAARLATQISTAFEVGKRKRRRRRNLETRKKRKIGKGSWRMKEVQAQKS